MTSMSFACAQIQDRCAEPLLMFCLMFPKMCHHTPDQVVKTVCRTCVCLGDPDICGLTSKEAAQRRYSLLSSISIWDRSRTLGVRILCQLKLSQDRSRQV